LFRNEVSVLREATRVFRGKSKAYRWLRGLNRTLGAIPLEMLGTESGRRKVMDELDRLAAGGDLVR
jgi:uncharacterized protein (DUF2384 family)